MSKHPGQTVECRVVRKGDWQPEFPETELGMHTIAQVLVRTIFHEGLHAATIRDILRFL